MANKLTSIIPSGTSNYLTPSLSFNRYATDLLTPGVIGFNTPVLGSVAPSTGSFGVSAQGSPNMTVAVNAGTAYVSATPSGGTAQIFAVTMDASENVTIAANATGSTRYDFVYLVLDTSKLNNPAVTGLDVATLTTQRSTTQYVDSNGALANALLLAEITVANGASSIANASIVDRRVMATVPSDGWISANDTWTYASSTTVTIAASQTGKYQVGDKVRLLQSGSIKYFYVTAISGTTLTLYGGSDYTVANATISHPQYSHGQSPLGFPSGFNFTPTWTSSGSAPSIGNGTFTGFLSLQGKTCYLRFKFVGGSTTTWGTGNYFVTLPITGYSGIAANDGFVLSGYAEDNGVLGYNVAHTRMNNTTTFYVFIQSPASASTVAWSQTTPFTWSTGDYWSATGFYDIA